MILFYIGLHWNSHYKGSLKEIHKDIHKESLRVLEAEGGSGALQTVFSKHHGFKICAYRVECALFHGAVERAVGARKTMVFKRNTCL